MYCGSENNSSKGNLEIEKNAIWIDNNVLGLIII